MQCIGLPSEVHKRASHRFHTIEYCSHLKEWILPLFRFQDDTIYSHEERVLFQYLEDFLFLLLEKKEVFEAVAMKKVSLCTGLNYAVRQTDQI